MAKPSRFQSIHLAAEARYDVKQWRWLGPEEGKPNLWAFTCKFYPGLHEVDATAGIIDLDSTGPIGSVLQAAIGPEKITQPRRDATEQRRRDRLFNTLVENCRV